MDRCRESNSSCCCCDWKIALAKVHVILRNNASNMKKVMKKMAVPVLGYFNHTLQLVVHGGFIHNSVLAMP